MMKIISTRLVPHATPHNPVKSTTTPSQQQRASASAGTGGQLSQAQQALDAMPEVDTAHVAQIKDALQQGRLSLDADTLSRAMMDYFRR